MGDVPPIRIWAMVENRHQPTAHSLRTLVTDDAKIPVCRNNDDSECFDLKNDPDEVHNLRHDPDAAVLKSSLLHRFVPLDIERGPSHYPRSTALIRNPYQGCRESRMPSCGIRAIHHDSFGVDLSYETGRWKTYPPAHTIRQSKTPSF